MLNLAKETERLKKNGADFVFYDSIKEGFTGVIVRDAEHTPDIRKYEENCRKLTELGYSYNGKYRKKKGCEVFIIETKKLEKLLE